MFPEVFLEKLNSARTLADRGQTILESNNDNARKAEDALKISKLLGKKLHEVEIDYMFTSNAPIAFTPAISKRYIEKLSLYFDEAIKMIDAKEAYLNE